MAGHHIEQYTTAHNDESRALLAGVAVFVPLIGLPL